MATYLYDEFDFSRLNRLQDNSSPLGEHSQNLDLTIFDDSPSKESSSKKRTNGSELEANVFRKVDLNRQGEEDQDGEVEESNIYLQEKRPRFSTNTGFSMENCHPSALQQHPEQLNEYQVWMAENCENYQGEGSGGPSCFYPPVQQHQLKMAAHLEHREDHHYHFEASDGQHFARNAIGQYGTYHHVQSQVPELQSSATIRQGPMQKNPQQHVARRMVFQERQFSQDLVHQQFIQNNGYAQTDPEIITLASSPEIPGYGGRQDKPDSSLLNMEEFFIPNGKVPKKNVYPSQTESQETVKSVLMKRLGIQKRKIDERGQGNFQMRSQHQSSYHNSSLGILQSPQVRYTSVHGAGRAKRIIVLNKDGQRVPAYRTYQGTLVPLTFNEQQPLNKQFCSASSSQYNLHQGTVQGQANQHIQLPWSRLKQTKPEEDTLSYLTLCILTALNCKNHAVVPGDVTRFALHYFPCYRYHPITHWKTSVRNHLFSSPHFSSDFNKEVGERRYQMKEDVVLESFITDSDRVYIEKSIGPELFRRMRNGELGIPRRVFYSLIKNPQVAGPENSAIYYHCLSIGIELREDSEYFQIYTEINQNLVEPRFDEERVRYNRPSRFRQEYLNLNQSTQREFTVEMAQRFHQNIQVYFDIQKRRRDQAREPNWQIVPHDVVLKKVIGYREGQ